MIEREKLVNQFNKLSPKLGDGGGVVNTVYLSICGEFACSPHVLVGSVWVT